MTGEREVAFKAADGWQIAGLLYIPERATSVPGVVLVHGSRHEGDAYGQLTSAGLPHSLSKHNVAVLRIDIRGRGASREPRVFNSFAPEEKKQVTLDVKAAIECLAAQPGVDAKRLGIVAEQDNAHAAALASARDRRIMAHVFISGRLGESAKKAMEKVSTPIFCLVSKEDRHGFKDVTDVYLASNNKQSRLKVFEGIGFGTTMFSAWQFEYPQEQPIEDMIGVWLGEKLNRSGKK
jgi:dienelactone hydrolase